jgi:hypothetical protein
MEKVLKRKIMGTGAFLLFLGTSAILCASAEAYTDNFDSYTPADNFFFTEEQMMEDGKDRIILRHLVHML